MSSMFETYETLSNQYIPSNMNKQPCPPQTTPLCPREPKKPYAEYNAEGELVGYWWNYGDTINLEFELEGNIDITESDNYITARNFIEGKQILVTLYNFRHEQIKTQLYNGSDEEFQAILFEVARNVNQKTSGVYYIQVKENEEIKYNKVMLPQDYNKDETYYKEKPVIVNFGIDTELSKTLTKGVYYCSLAILDSSINATVLGQEECTLNVR